MVFALVFHFLSTVSLQNPNSSGIRTLRSRPIYRQSRFWIDSLDHFIVSRLVQLFRGWLKKDRKSIFPSIWLLDISGYRRSGFWTLSAWKYMWNWKQMQKEALMNLCLFPDCQLGRCGRSQGDLWPTKVKSIPYWAKSSKPQDFCCYHSSPKILPAVNHLVGFFTVSLKEEEDDISCAVVNQMWAWLFSVAEIIF